MKKLTVSLVALFIIASASLFAQQLVTVQRAGEIVATYPSLNQAVFDNVQDDDIVYLSAGVFGDNTLTINNKISLIGVGVFPNSGPIAPGYTEIEKSVTLKAGASGSFVSGIRFSSAFYLGQGTYDTLLNVTLERCRFEYYLYLGNMSSGSSSSHIIKHNVIKHLHGSAKVLSCVISNNFIDYVSSFTEYSAFYNNVFTGSVGNYSIGASYCAFHNNIIFKYRSYNFLNGSWNQFNNNIFVGFTPTVADNNTYEDCFDNISPDSIFVEYQYVVNQEYPQFVFNYDHNYQLKENCVGVGAGDDETDLGVYGGMFPWKEKLYLVNPRVSTFNVTPVVPESGLINVEASAEGQSR